MNLICNGFLIFRSNCFKRNRIMQVNACAGGFYVFKNMRLLLDMFLSPTFKITTNFASVARTTATTCKFIYYERFQIIRS